MKQTIFILIFLFASNISLAQGELSPSDKWMFFYYQNPQPDKLIENVLAMSKRGQLANVQTAGVIPTFLSRVFAQNPGRISQWMTSLKDLPQNELYTLYNALWLSNTNEGRAILAKAGLQLPGSAAPDLLILEVNEPMLIDALWGYFMATGETRVVRRVISGFNYSKYQGADKRYKSSKQTDQDKQEAYKAIIFEAAKASLIDNCLMHPVVLASCEKLLKEEELNQTESLWLGVVLAKVAPEKYKLEITKPVSIYANPQSNEKRGIWDRGVYTADTIKLAEQTKAIWIVMDAKDSKLNFSTDNAQELLKHYFSQPESKRSKGIFIYSKSYAVPDTPEERAWMTEYLQGLYDDPLWRKSESELVAKLIKACISSQVPLYVNMSTNLQGEWKVLNEPQEKTGK